MIFCSNPTCSKYKLHKWHEQSSGSQKLMFDLKMLTFSESFIFCGTRSYIFVSKYDTVSDPS